MLLRTLSRTSSKPKRNAQPPVSIFVVASKSVARQSFHFPTELLEIIASMILSQSYTDTRASFRAIASFARVSKTFRHVAFRNFLQSLRLPDSACWNGIYKMVSMHQSRNPDSKVFTFLRSLTTRTKSIIEKCSRLTVLTKIQKLTLFFDKEGLSTQHSVCLKLFLNFSPSANTLSALTVDLIPRIDRSLLLVISKTFPCLTILNVSVTGRLVSTLNDCDCWCCFENVLECSVHSPVPLVYGDVTLLAEAFSFALSSLSQLTELRLGIFLSDEAIIHNHISHQSEDDYTAKSPSSCDVCENTVGVVVRAREVLASKIIFSRLDNLRRICWSTFFYHAHLEDGMLDPTTTQPEEAFQSGFVEFELARPEGTLQTRRTRALR